MKCTFDAKKFAYFLFFSHLFKVTSIEKATCLFLNIELFANSRGELSTYYYKKLKEYPLMRLYFRIATVFYLIT